MLLALLSATGFYPSPHTTSLQLRAQLLQLLNQQKIHLLLAEFAFCWISELNRLLEEHGSRSSSRSVPQGPGGPSPAKWSCIAYIHLLQHRWLGHWAQKDLWLGDTTLQGSTR